MNFSLSLHDWSAFSCIRFVISCYSGNPVSPKIMFSAIRLDRFTVFMLSVGQKFIFNRSWWYEVDNFWMWTLYSIYGCGPCKSCYSGNPVSSFSRFTLWCDQNEFFIIPAWLKCIFMHPVCQKLLFRESGLSQNHVFSYSARPVYSFHAFGWSKVYF